jgi:hypothetical protein
MFDDLKNGNQPVKQAADQPAASPNVGFGPQDDVNFAKGSAPVNPPPAKTMPAGPKLAEDIFSGVEKHEPLSKPAVFEPKPAATAPASPIENEESHLAKKIILLAAGALIFASLVYGGYYGYTRYGKGLLSGAKTTEVSKPAAETPAPVSSEPAAEPSAEPEPVAIPAEPEPAALPDADQDGLTDEEETALGMDANSVDSDGDGLFDREEVKVYKTDPLDNDTDNDTFLDGDEVKGGYNPLGPGKLYEVE